VSRITRKELKSDKFALEVEHTVDFFEKHRAQAGRYAAIALGVVVLVLGYLYYSRSQHGAREQALSRALQVMEAPVGQANPNAPLSFPTEEAKQQESVKRLTDIVSKYSGSDQAHIAMYFLASISADQGKLPEAEKRFKDVADNANANYSSLAKLSLAQIYFADGRTAEGEKLLRSLIDKPTDLVSKEQATVALARGLMASKPADARKLLEPLRAVPGAVGQVALSLYGEIPQ
jgi:predicted negative regulator of RcsB-dependent stress response